MFDDKKNKNKFDKSIDDEFDDFDTDDDFDDLDLDQDTENIAELDHEKLNEQNNFKADQVQSVTSDNALRQKNISSSGLSVDDILININVVAGSIDLNLSQLHELNNGDLLKLGNLPPQVKLVTSNNQYLGDGILVNIDGRLGVKLINKSLK